MRLTYENERGKVTMYGGGNIRGINILTINGLSIPENNVSTVRYPNQAGQFVTKSTPMERFITIAADVYDENTKHISNAQKVFSLPGILYITTSEKTKKINCRCVSFDTGVKKGSYAPFTVQFCADNPYFEDIYETKRSISKREGNIKAPFVLGCEFSKRHTENNVINSGDVSIEPVFEITSEKGIICPDGITIKNKTNGNFITLDTEISAGETITVDIKNRKIMSSVRGNIISCIRKETSLSRFLIDTGVSLVEIATPGATGELSGLIKYRNSYAALSV